VKTNRFENGTFENAKEHNGEAHRVSVSKQRKVARISASRSTIPPRSIRQHPRREPEAVTTVTARLDVGFGNSLFIRGEGEGLSWDKGRLLVCIEGATWVWSSQRAKDHVRFKLLINDQLWCRGENMEIAPGGSVEVVPTF